MVNVETAVVENGKDKGSGRLVISVASHDSIERVKLTRAVDISTNSTCMQLSAP